MGSLKAALDRVVHPCTAALFCSVLVISSPLCQNNRSLNTKTYCQNVLLCMDNYELADLLWGQLFEPRACCGGSDLKSVKKTPYIIPNSMYFSKGCSKASKSASKPTLDTPFWAWSWLGGQIWYLINIKRLLILSLTICIYQRMH